MITVLLRLLTRLDAYAARRSAEVVPAAHKTQRAADLGVFDCCQALCPPDCGGVHLNPCLCQETANARS